MALCLHNTLTRRVEAFEPLEPGKAGVYACGPTIYGHAHIGNFRTFLFYDLFRRYLEWRGFDVRFVMNLTDVDDKTIEAAVAEGTTIREYTTPYGEAVLQDLDALGVRRFHAYPRATDYVGPMLEMIQALLDRGLAYQTEDGSVFYDISSFPSYGRLSGVDTEQVRQGERVAHDEYGKDDVRDFALWKAAQPQDERAGAAWDAPWGRGRPGWHLECSAMGLREVGETLDVHLGGEDLIFPHHEDEIAQSEGATGQPFARYWVHVKHLLVEGRKMSKSLGNFIRVRDLLEEGVDPAAVRHQLLSAHYRSELNFTRQGLEASRRAVERLLDFEARLEAVVPADGAGKRAPESEEAHDPVDEAADRALQAFQQAMDDDLNVPEAVAAIFVFVGEVNGVLDDTGDVLAPHTRARALDILQSTDRVLGFLEVGRRAQDAVALDREWIETQVQLREKARAEKDFETADRIRDELRENGIVLEDSPRGTRWKVAGVTETSTA